MLEANLAEIFHLLKMRAGLGGPVQTIERRYSNGLSNFFKIYKPIVNQWILIDNSMENFEFIAEGSGAEVIIRSEKKWSLLKRFMMEINEQLQELEEKVNRGLKEAYRKMTEFKKKNNSPLIVSRDGKVISIPANEILPTTSSKNESLGTPSQ